MVDAAPDLTRASRVAVSGSIRSMKKRAVTSFAFRRAAAPLAFGNLAIAASAILHHMSALGAQVKLLSDKVDRLAADNGASALNNIEQRIDALSRSLTARTNAGESVPPRLEMLVQTLSDKVDQIQQSGNDTVAFGHLEDRIVKLGQRLDSSDARLGQLDAIERGLADLLVHARNLGQCRLS